MSNKITEDEALSRHQAFIERKRQAEEQWKDIPGYEGRYKCSDMGNVQSLISLRPMSLTKDTNGYITVGLSKDSKCKKRWVHQLVLMTFIGPRPPQMEAAHLNGKRDDNRLENLRWCSRKENHAHKKQHGTYKEKQFKRAGNKVRSNANNNRKNS